MASDSQKITLLYKKNFGVTDTQGTAAVSQESITSRARIIPSIQILQQPIPTALPTDFTRDLSFTKGQRWTSASYPYIVKYVNVTLKHINLYESYWFTDATAANPELNILTSAIPASYGAGFYQTIVYDSAGNPLSAAGTYPWVFDVDGGVLKFFNNLTAVNAPPTISFYRYEGTFGLSAATLSSFTNLYASTLQLSTLVFRDLYTNTPGALTLSNGLLYLNGAVLSGGASDTSLTSTTVGLGTLGYISSSQLLSSLKTLGALGYLSSVPSTFVSSSQLFSSIEGLGSMGYLSSLSLSSIISTPQLTSSLIGLGTLGYISSVPSSFISSATLFSTIEGLGTLGYLSSPMTNLSSIISTPQLTSSLVGLGTLGYISSVPSSFISSATLFSSIQGLGSLGYISSSQLTSTAQGLTTYINSFIDPQELASSITGLGTVQFISSIGLLSTSQGLADYITSFIDPLELASTVTGLGSAQYVSTTVTATNAIFTSSLVGLGSMGYLSSAVTNLSSIISTPQLTSSLQGLGSMGYISSLSSIGNNLSSFSTSLALSFKTQTGFISSLTVSSLSFGSGNGYINFPDLRATSLSTLILSVSSINNEPIFGRSLLQSTLQGLGSMGYLSSAINNLSSIISTPQLTSSLVGLGTLGYVSSVPSTFISSATLFSSLQALGSMGYISSAQLTSTAQGLTTYINSFIDPQELASSITGLGTLQFVSSIGLLSTSQGLANYITSFIDPQELASTVTGLGSAQYVSTTVTATNGIFTSSLVGLGSMGYLSSAITNLSSIISTPQLTSSLQGLGSMGYLSSIPSSFISSATLFSSLQGLGSMGYLSTLPSTFISSASLFSSLRGLGSMGYLSTIPSTFISTGQLQSSLQGLGTLGYLSTPSLVSTVSSMADHFKILSAAVSSLNASNIYSVQGYISSLRVDILTFGDGTGWADFGAVRAVVVSTLEIDSGIIYGTTISSSRFVGDGSLLSNLNIPAITISSIISTPQLTSSLVGLGTLRYLSSVPSTFISSATLFSSLQALGSMGYISSAQLTSTAQGLTTYINSFIDPQELASSITGLGTLQFVSSIGLLSTSQGLANYITSFIDPQELASTVTGLGTAQYVSTTVTATNAIFTSSLVGLGSMGYLSSAITNLSSIISTPQLTSSLQGLGTLRYLSSVPSTFISSATLFSSLQGLGSMGYISSTQLISTTQGVTTYVNSLISPAAVGSTILSSVTSTLIGTGIGVQASFLRGSASAGQTTNLTVGSSVVFNQVDATSGSDISLNTTTSVITLAANRTYRLVGSVPNVQGSGIRISVQWSNITSGSLGGSIQSYYSPTNGASYAASGSEAEYIFTPSVTTTVAFTIVTNGGVTQLGGNTDFSLNGSYPWFEVEVIGSWAPYIAPSLVNFVSTPSLTSSLQGLGSMGYLSSAVTNLSSIISTPQLTSSLVGLGSMRYLSSVPSTFISSASLFSSLQGLGSMGYLSSAVTNLSSIISTPQLTSSLQGLGSMGYLSTPSLVSTVASMANNFRILSAAVSSLNASNIYSVQGYISSLQVDSLQIGTGTGWVDFGAVRALIVSTLEINSGIIYGTTISSSRFVGDGSLLSNLNIPAITPQLTSSLVGLGSMDYISSAQLTSTAQGLTSYINSFIDPQELASSITGLGTVQFVSSIGLLSTSQGLADYITSFIDPQELASTVTGLGSAQYVSTTVTATNAILTSSLVGLGSLGYLSTVPSTFISSSQLFSTIAGLGTYGYLSSLNNLVSTNYLNTVLGSTITGLGTSRYISTLSNVPLVSSVQLIGSSFFGNLGDAQTLIIVDM